MPDDKKTNETSLTPQPQQELMRRTALVKRGLEDIFQDGNALGLAQFPSEWPQLLDPEEPWPDEGPDQLHGGPTDLGNAQRLATQELWAEALAIMEAILALPANVQASKYRLNAVMKDTSQVRMEYKSLGKDTSGQYQAKSRARLGGGSAAAVMAFRAQCLTGVMINLITASRKSGKQRIVDDPAFSHLHAKAADHLVLVRELFYSDPENLVRAASLCYASDQLQPSQAACQLVQRALEIAPANEMAAALLRLLEKRMAEASRT